MRKSLSLLLALLLVLGLAPTAALAEESQFDWLLDTSPVTISLFEDWPTTNVDDANSIAIKNIENITGVKLERSFPVAWDGKDLMFGLISGSLPDIIVMETSAEWRASFVDQARQADAIWAYDDLIEQYAPHFKELVAPEYFEMFKSEDGKTYEYVNAINTALAEEKKQEFGVVGGSGATIVRKDYFDEIGAPDVSTPDGLIAALKAMQEKHPDLVPIMTPADIWRSPMGDFGAQFNVPPYYVNDGKVLDQMKSENALTTTLFVNRLAREGLLPKEALIEGTDVQAMVFNGQLLSYFWNTREEGKVPDDNPDTIYTSLPPFSTWGGYKTSTIGGWKTILISKNCKNPERAIRLLEFMASEEGHRVLYWGIEGDAPENGGVWSEDFANGPHYYIDAQGKPTYYPEYWAAKLADWDGVALKSGLKEICYGEDAYYANVQTWNSEDPVAKKEASFYGGKTEYAPWFAIKTIPGSEEDNILARIKIIKKNYVAPIVFAESEEVCKAEYDKMLLEMEEAGLETLEAFYTAEYESLLAKYKQ